MDDLIQRLRVEPTASQFLRTGDLVESLVAERKEAADRIAALEAEKAERERQEPVAWAWDDALGCMHVHCGSRRPEWVDRECSDAMRAEMNLRKLYDAPPVPHIDPDWLANFIRRSNPQMTMTSDELAEKIADAINGEGEMTTDELRHLLEMAARACALEVKCTGENYNGLTLWVRDSSDCPWFPWAPHTDDCDSARMRSALLIDVDWLLGENDITSFGVMCWNDKSAHELFADHNGDRNAALRLCALRVAAMIGEVMK